jgi:GAF domain-containing protein
VDGDRDFYKSAHGFGEPLATTRQLEGRTFCHYAIRSTEPLIINDTKADPVYRTVPTVESLGVAAYLGVPVSGPTGHVLGSFCAIDFVPRQWSERDLAVLRELALSAEREIKLRVRAREVEARNASLEDLTAELQAQVEENRALAQSLEELRRGGVS